MRCDVLMCYFLLVRYRVDALPDPKRRLGGAAAPGGERGESPPVSSRDLLKVRSCLLAAASCSCNAPDTVCDVSMHGMHACTTSVLHKWTRTMLLWSWKRSP